ncbi:MAG: hypothetical protein LBF21_00900, partial [Puniceicoccales bacterium]|nr:hypothetical protein [Puniceicoccales bacterium]
MDIRKIGFMGVMCIASFAGCIPDTAATPWEEMEARFSRWVTQHEVEFLDEVSCVRRELRYLQEMEKRNPWDNFPSRLSEEYPAIAEEWIRPVQLTFPKEGFMGTREEWQAKHKGILLRYLEHLRGLFQANTEDLEALIALITPTRTVDEQERVSEETPPFGEVEVGGASQEVHNWDIDVDQYLLLKEEIRQMDEMNAQFLREKFSFTDEQVEQFRTTFGRIYEELIG